MTSQSAAVSAKTPRKAALSSWIGSALEYYDFAVYGTAAALVLNQLFFPQDTNSAVAILASMATVGIAYVVRPLGALIMGPLGDKYGRKFVLMLSLFLIGGATFTVGCLPTYEQVGLWAPFFLVVCRIIQGISASGEQSSAISASLEHAEEHRRGFITSWTLHGTQFGTLLATAVFIPFTFFLSEEQLLSWGWRVPFWLSAVVVFVAWAIRRSLEEPPAFHEATQPDKRARVTPLKQVLVQHKGAVARIAAAAMVNTVNVVFVVWSLSYATTIVGLDRSTMLWVPVAANGVALLTIPMSGALSDRIGRKKVFLSGVVGSAVLMFAYLAAVTSGNWIAIFACGIVMSGGFYSMANATWPAFYAEMLPTSVRVTGLAMGTQIGFAISGGITPVLAAAVVGSEGAAWGNVALVVLGACLLAAFAAGTATETAHDPLEKIDVRHELAGVRG